MDETSGLIILEKKQNKNVECSNSIRMKKWRVKKGIDEKLATGPERRRGWRCRNWQVAKNGGKNGGKNGKRMTEMAYEDWSTIAAGIQPLDASGRPMLAVKSTLRSGCISTKSGIGEYDANRRPTRAAVVTHFTHVGWHRRRHAHVVFRVCFGWWLCFFSFLFFSEFFSLSLCGVGVGLVWGCLGSGKNFGQWNWGVNNNLVWNSLAKLWLMREW